MTTEVFSPANYAPSVIAIPLFVAMMAILLLGFLVLIRERVSLISVLFFLVTLSASIWLASFVGVYLAAQEEVALWWARASYLGVPFIASATYHFAVAVLRIYERYKAVVWAGWAISTLFSLAGLHTDALVGGLHHYWWGYYPSFNWLGSVFLVYFFGMFLLSMYHYWKGYRRAEPGTHKRRIQSFMIAFAFGYVGSVDYVATYGIPLYPFGYLAASAFVLISARAIWTYHLADITPAFAARQIIDTMTDGVLVFDGEGVLRLVNRTAGTLLGYTERELVSRPLAAAIGEALFAGQFKTLAQGGTVRDYETSYQPKSGEKRTLSLSASVMRDTNERLTAVVCIARDVTEHKEAEEEIRQLNEDLEHRVIERTAALQASNLELGHEIIERKHSEKALRESEQSYRALLTTAQRQARELTLLDRVHAAISRELDLPLLFRTVVEAIAQTFGYTQVSLFLREGEVLSLQHQVGYDRMIPRISIAEGIAGRVVRTGKPVLLEDTSTDPDFLEAIEGTVSEVCVPLFDQEKVAGVLILESVDNTLTEADLRLMTALSEQISIAIGRARLYAQVVESEQKYRSVVESVKEVIFQTDTSGRWVFLNPAWTELTGFALEESTGTTALSYVHHDDRQRYREHFQMLIEGKRQFARHEIRYLTNDGGFRWVELHAQATLDSEGAIVGTSGTLNDVTERKALGEQLVHQAFHDPLTHLPNRTFFMERLTRSLSAARGRAHSVAVLFLDLDNFKVVNDSLGHRAGDQLLIMVGKRLQSCVRPSDTVARLGGDEFIVLLEEIVDGSKAGYLAERIAQQLEAPFSIEGHEVFLAASVGIALSSSEYDQPDDLLRNADMAMYEAKKKGKARYAMFNPGMNLRALARLELESEMRRALELGEFVVYYQPIVQLSTGRVVEVEALVRWQHPQRGLISPLDFIPLAEETGLILPLGEWVLKEACRQVRLWQTQYTSDSPLTLSVNLSARQFRQPNLVRDIDHIIRQTGLNPRYLKLEITESVALHNEELSMSTLQELRAIGIHIAIDDFGTGYSALGYLKHYPVDTLKLDRSFVQGLGHDPKDTAIVRATITMAQALDMTVTGEGIETGEQLAGLRALGCDLGQGYYFSRPVPSHEIEAQLATQRALTSGYLRQSVLLTA